MLENDKIDVLDGFSSIITGKNMIDGFDPNIPFVEPEDIPGIESEEITEVDPEEITEEVEPEEIEEEEVEEVKPKISIKPESVDEDPETEEMISKLLQERLSESLGYEFDDKEKFNKVQDVVDYLENLVNDASVPQYANDEVAKLDDYVKNGGNLKNYFNTVYERNFNIDEIDITDPSDQKRVIKEALKEQGVKDDVISKRIERYENSGALDDEAMEAQEFILENKDKKEQTLLATQREHATQIKERQREFVSTVEQTIDKMVDIFGTKLTAKEKMELKPYILRPTSDGMTRYQKEYTDKEKYVNNLITSAYFTMKGDAFVKRTKEQATSDTYKNIQKKLQDKKDTRITGSNDQTSRGNGPDLSSLSRFISRK